MGKLGGVDPLNFRLKKDELHKWLFFFYDFLLELLNEAGDVFLLLTMWQSNNEKIRVLAWVSSTSLAVTMLARVIAILLAVQRLDTGASSRGWFLAGSFLTLLDPTNGVKVMSKGFRKSEQHVQVKIHRSDSDSREVNQDVVNARNDVQTVRMEIVAAMGFVLLEDVPELIVEFAYAVESQDLSYALVFSTVGTVLHIIRQLVELAFNMLYWKSLREVDTSLEKSFEEDTLDKDVQEFVTKHGHSCQNIEFTRARNIKEAAVAEIANCLNLRRAYLSTKKEDAQQWSHVVTHDALAKFAFKNLTDLRLSFCQSVTDATLLSLSQRCPQLNTLHLNNTSITDQGVCDMAERLRVTNLLIGFNDIGDRAVLGLRRSAATLVELQLYGCKRVTNDALMQLGQTCRDLQTLYLGQTGVTDEGVACLAQYNSSLATVYLNQTATGDASVDALTKCASIKLLDFRSSSLLTDRGLHQIMHQMKKAAWKDFTELDVRSVANVSTEKLRTLEAACPSLVLSKTTFLV